MRMVRQAGRTTGRTAGVDPRRVRRHVAVSAAITALGGLLFGAVIGALAAGRVSDWIGRRFTVLITAVVFIVGVLLAAFTPTYPVLLVARIIIGLAVGSASMVVPLYI